MNGIARQNPWAFNGQDWETWWDSIKAQAFDRASLNVAADKVPHLTNTEREQAYNLASNYFEQGYQAVMTGVSNANKCTFTRLGGMT